MRCLVPITLTAGLALLAGGAHCEPIVLEAEAFRIHRAAEAASAKMAKYPIAALAETAASGGKQVCFGAVSGETKCRGERC